MATLRIPFNNVSELKKSLRDLPVLRPTMVMLHGDRTTTSDEAIVGILAAFRLPQYVTELIVKAHALPSKKLADAVTKLIMNGPSHVSIENWPGDQLSSLMNTLVDKKDLSILSIRARHSCQPFAKLAKRLQSLNLIFADETSEMDWSELGDAIATSSSTLTQLFFEGNVPESAFPPHLPAHLGDFDVASEWALSFDWLSHSYWPTKLDRLSLTGRHEFVKLPELTDIMKIRLRGIPELELYVGTECVEPVCDLLSIKNHIDDLSFGGGNSLDQLMQLVRSPFALMSRLAISHELGDTDECTLFEAIRGKTRTVYWELHGSNGSESVIQEETDWFLVMQALLSVHELSRLKKGCPAGLVPWRDHIIRIASTLGWDLDDCCYDIDSESEDEAPQ